MKTKLRSILFFALTLTLLSSAAYAASEIDTSAALLAERGILEGDQTGNLNLGKSLTRAELAVILTRLDFTDSPGGLSKWREWGLAHFADPQNRYNSFTDVPNWALPYVEYCYQRGLMKGVGDNSFDPQSEVNPKMACTVILRHCNAAETDWDYETSLAKAQSLGIAPYEGMSGSVILRGAMAVIIRRGMDYESGHPAASETPAASKSPAVSETPAASGVSGVTVPSPQLTPPSGSAECAMTISEMKEEIVRLTNEERLKAGLQALQILPELMDCAGLKAQDFIDNHYYAHVSPLYGTASEMIFRFVPEAGTAAENITGWSKTPEEAFESWMTSTKGHREIILTARLTHIGVGIAAGADGGYWWVAQYVKL